MENKKLLRSRSDRKISGVCGGIAAYLGVDSNVVRLVTIIAGFASVGTAALVYLAAALLLPEE